MELDSGSSAWIRANEGSAFMEFTDGEGRLLGNNVNFLALRGEHNAKEVKDGCGTEVRGSRFRNERSRQEGQMHNILCTF